MTTLFAIGWCVALALAALAVSRALRLRSPPVAAGVVALVAGSSALRVAVATFGPGDLWVNMRVADYGMAPVALLDMLGVGGSSMRVGGTWVNLVAGSLVPVVTVAAVRAVGGGSRWAWFAGIAVAFNPVFAVYSGQTNRIALEVLLAASALLGLGDEPARGAGRAAGRGAILYLVATVLLLETRPEAVWFVPCLFAMTIALRPRHGGWSPTVWTANAWIAFFVVARALSWRANHVEQYGDRILTFRWLLLPGHDIWATPAVTPWLVVLLTYAGLLVALVARHRLAVALAASIVVLSHGFGTAPPVVPDVGTEFANLRYHALALFIALLLAAFTTDQLIARVPSARRGAASAVLAIAFALTTVGPLRTMAVPKTVDEEYAFAVAALAALPPEAEIYSPATSTSYTYDYGLRADVQLSRFAGRPGHVWREWPPPPTPSDLPRFLYFGSGCAADMEAILPAISGEAIERTERMLANCDDALAAVDPDPVASIDVVNRRFAIDMYVDGAVPIAIYRIDPDALARSRGGDVPAPPSDGSGEP